MSDARATPGPDELLRELEWLRRLAAGLIRDPGASDDVAQEAALAALKRPPRGARKPWLARVARNFVRQRKRSDSRRDRRESLPRPHREAPAPDEIAARTEIHRIVAALVDDLPEPARTVVVLRYHEDLRPTEIAHRLGVPAGTVRARLHRALATLRERLDERHDGRRDAWVAALFPLARSAWEGNEPGRFPTRAALAAGVAAIVALGTWLAWDGATDRTAEDPVEVSSADTADDSGSRTEAAAVDDRATETAAAAPPHRVRLTGRVVAADGSPTTGARVQVSPLVGDDDRVLAMGDIVAVLEARSAGTRSVPCSEGGVFSLDLSPRDHVRLHALGGDAVSSGLVVVAEDDREDLVLVLERSLRVAGEVLDESGRPVAGARVAFVAPRRGRPVRALAVADDDGRFVLQVGDDPGTFQFRCLIADHAEFAPAIVKYQRADGFVRIALARGAEIVGRVVDHSGHAVAGASVRVVPRFTSQELAFGHPQFRAPADVTTRTGPDGHFRSPRFGSGTTGPCAIVVTAEAGRGVVRECAFPIGEPLEIELPPPTALRCIVVDQRRVPVSGMDVAFECGIAAPGSWPDVGEAATAVVSRGAVRTEPDGSFVVPAPLGAHVQMRPKSLDERHAFKQWMSRTAAISDAVLTLELKERAKAVTHDAAAGRPDPVPVSGRVVDAAGHPVRGARVYVRTQKPHREAGRTWTDGDGRWSLDVRGPGQTFVAVFASGFVEGSESGDLEGTGGALPDVVMQPEVPVLGTVVSDGGEPVAGALVEVVCRRLESTRTLSDAAGRFTVHGFPAGAEAFVHEARGFLRQAETTQVDPETGAVELVLRRGGEIRGRLVRSTGQGVGGVHILAIGLKDGRRHLAPFETYSDGLGRFSFDSLPEGSFDLLLFGDGPEVARGSIATGTTGIEWVLDAGAPIMGRVVGPKGQPFAGARIVYARDDEGEAAPARPARAAKPSDSDGRFRIERVGAGTYAVWVDHAELGTTVLRGVVPGETGVTVALRGDARLSGVLVDPDGNPVAGFVNVLPAAGFGPARHRVWAGADDGRFSVTALPDTELTVQAVPSYAVTSLRQGVIEHGPVRPGETLVRIEIPWRE